jgi:hypothetical protein
MGRTLFSQAYAAPAVRTEPEPQVDICERWSVWNRFDPDSEIFFQDAEYEAFIDPVQLEREAAALATEVAVDSSDSSDGSVSDSGSPMAVGSDDGIAIISDVLAAAEAEWAIRRGSAPDTRSPSALEIPAFFPPSFLREPTPSPEANSTTSSDPPRSPIVRRAVNITPISVPRERVVQVDRSPSPDFPPLPSTPPPQPREQPDTLFSMSSPPSVTPRFYSWQHHPIPALPSSPSQARGNRDGPLTNPRARMSFARIDSSPPRLRIPNPVQ